MSKIYRKLTQVFLDKATTRQNKNGYIVLDRTKNKTLFNFLDKINYFKFNTTNKGDTTNYHQVVAFLHCGGWQAYKNGFTASKETINVHHLNDVKDDNKPSNLVYVSTTDHLYITDATQTALYGKTYIGSSPTPFNKQGKPVTNPKHYLSNLIKATKLLAKRIDQDIVVIMGMLPYDIYNSVTKRLHYSDLKSIKNLDLITSNIKALSLPIFNYA